MGDWADLCVAIDDQGDMKDVCEEIEYQKHRTHAQAAKEAWAGPTGDWLELCSVADDYEKKGFEDMCQYLDMEADPSQSTGRKLAMSSDSQVGVVVAGKKGFALPSQGMQTVIRKSGALSQHDRRCGTCKDRMNGGTVNLCITKVPSSGPIHLGRPAGTDLSRLQADAFLAKPMPWRGSRHSVSQRSNAAPKVPALASTASDEPQQVHSDWNGPMGDWADLCVAIDDQGDMKDVCEEIEYQKHRTHAQAAKEAWSGPTGDWLELCSVADDYEKKDFEDMCQYLDMEADPSQSTGRKLAMSSDSQVGVVVAGKKGFALPSQGMQTVIRNSGALSQHDRRCGTCKDRMNGGTVNLCMTKVPSSGPIHMGRPAGTDLSRLQADAFLAKPMFWHNNAAPKVPALASTGS